MSRIALLTGAALLCCVCARSEASVLIVDASGAGDFETVQEAVDAAVGRDSILIRAGVYEENVLCTGKYLTFIGEGPGVTILKGVIDAPTVEIRGMTDWPFRTCFHDMTVERSPSNAWAVYWDRRRGWLYGCELVGAVGSWNGEDSGNVCLYGCTATSVLADGGVTPSELEDSVVDSARFRGEWFTNQWNYTYWSPHRARVNGCQIRAITLDGGKLESAGDVIGQVWGDVHARFLASDSTIESVRVGAELELISCSVDGDAVLIGGTAYSLALYTGEVRVIRSFVGGDLMVRVWEGEYAAYPQARVEQSTILGNLTCDYDTWESWSPELNDIRSNIVGGSTYVHLSFVDVPIVTHNDCVGGLQVVGVQDSVHSNISLPALFCDPTSADYTLQECSPCVGAAHDGGDIGVYGVGCQCLSTVQSRSWGAIKAMYR